MKTLIIGLGNPLRGDDGVGPRVVQELAHLDLPGGVEAIDGGGAGLGLLDLMEGWDRVVIVDAAEIGGDGGEFVRFTPADARLVSTADSFTVHRAGLSEALALAAALDRSLPEIVIFGIQPAAIDWKEGLSPVVEGALPDVIRAVMAEVEDRE